MNKFFKILAGLVLVAMVGAGCATKPQPTLYYLPGQSGYVMSVPAGSPPPPANLVIITSAPQVMRRVSPVYIAPAPDVGGLLPTR